MLTRQFTIFVAIVLLSAVRSHSEEVLWVYGTGGPAQDSHCGILLDASDHLYTCGEFSGTMDFDPGPGTFELTASGTQDMFITKMDRDGRLLWVRQFGGTGGTGGTLRTLGSDADGNLYVAGGFTGTTDFDPGPGTFNLTAAEGSRFILKLDPAGGFIWVRQIGYSPWTLSAGPSGVRVAGEFFGTVDLDPGPGTFELTSVGEGDGFVVGLDSAGTFVWGGQIAGQQGEEFLFRMVAEPGGGTYIVGQGGYGPVDFDPGPGVQILDAGGFVLKLDSAGNFVWVRPITSGGGGSRAYGAVVDAAGHVHASGYFTGTVDFDPGPGTFMLTSVPSFQDGFITEFDSAGSFIRAAQIGGDGPQYVMAIATDSSGSLYATGTFVNTTDFDPGPATFNLTSAGSSDVYAAKFDPAYNLVWAAGLGGSLGEGAHDIAVDSSNNVHVIGLFNGTADFDPGPGVLPLTSAGGADVFVWRYGSCDIRLEGGAATSIRFSPDAPSSFDIVTGLLSDLHANGDYSQADCLGSFSASPATDLSVPPVGTGYYYLSRGLSICAAQGYGDSTLDPDPRDALDLVGPCP
jgi:hypothetical protein